MSTQAEALAEELIRIDRDIEECKLDIQDAESDLQYHAAFTAREALYVDRNRIVEQLEEIGLEDPDL